MKFDDLAKLITESGFRPDSSKNRGYYSRAMSNVGPMGVTGQQSGIGSGGERVGAETSRGYSSSSVGKADNFEKRTKTDQMKKYLFDTSKAGDQSDVYELTAENKYRMRNAFALLFNSKKFHTEFNNIFRNYLSLDSINVEDEREWNRLKDEVQTRESRTTGYRDNVEQYQMEYDEMLASNTKYLEIKEYVKKLESQKKNTKDPEVRKEIEIKLDAAKIDMFTVKSNTKGFDDAAKNLQDAKNKLINETEKEIIARKKWEEINDKISSVGANNKKKSDTVIKSCKKLINNVADGLLDRYQIENDISDEAINSVNVDFANVPKDIVSKLGLLKELTTDDNPIFAFIDSHEEQFAERITSFDDRTLNKSINIGVMRMFDKIPAKILASYFSTIAGRGIERKVIPLENLNTNPKTLAIDNMIKKLESIKTKEEWESSRKELMKMAKDLPFDKTSNDIIKQRIKSFWQVTGRGTIAQTLVYQIESMKKEQNRNLIESFDDVAGRILSQFSFDEDDYKLDLMEVIEEKSKKCTGPTKKASSDRKGKKWTKCAKQPDGSYKRIHWGQAGVRVTGKSGNTKRKKSFRARHNCANAKQGSANAESCKDW
jgi:hypothetical protein